MALEDHSLHSCRRHCCGVMINILERGLYFVCLDGPEVYKLPLNDGALQFWKSGRVGDGGREGGGPGLGDI